MDWSNFKQMIVAIDPGITGAICLYLDRDNYRLLDMPETDHDIAELLKYPWLQFDEDPYDTITEQSLQLPPIKVWIEIVGGRPGNGGRQAFNFGDNNGFCRACCICCGYRLDKISSQKWQRHFNLPTLKKAGSYYKKKKAHRQKAQQLFPEIAKQVSHNNADALLMALYLWEQQNQRIRVTAKRRRRRV